MLQLKVMFSKEFIILIVLNLALVYHEVGGIPTSVLEELREQVQSGVDLDLMTDQVDTPHIAQDRMGPYTTSGFQVPAHISTLSNDQISNYLQSRVDSQPHLLSDAQILPGPEVSEDSQEEYDSNTIFSDEDASLEDQVLSQEEYGDSAKVASPSPAPGGHKNRKKHKPKAKDVSVEVHIDSGDDNDKYLLGASSDTYGKFTAVGGSPGHGNDVLMDLAPSWPPEFREPHKGSVDYVLIPMIMIGIIVPMFVVLYVIVGSMIAKMQPQSLLRKKRSPEGPLEDNWTDLTLDILNLLGDWTFDP